MLGVFRYPGIIIDWDLIITIVSLMIALISIAVVKGEGKIREMMRIRGMAVMAALCLCAGFLSACGGGGGGGFQDGDAPYQIYNRSLVRGMDRLWQERGRVAGAQSRLYIVDVFPPHHFQSHGIGASLVADSFSFLPSIPADSTAIQALRSAPSGTSILNRSGAKDFFDELLTVLTERDSILVYPLDRVFDNSPPDEGDPERQRAFAAAAATGLVLVAGALDYELMLEGHYAVHPESAVCGARIKISCVMTFFRTMLPNSYRERYRPGTPDGDLLNDSPSFSTGPIIAGTLNSIRLLWPEMTSREAVNLVRYCARPINDDGTLAPWGTILTQETASDLWGQGVFSVECLFDENGALNNPLYPDRPLRGGLVLSGGRGDLTLTDRFGRDYSLSRGGHFSFIADFPFISGLFGTSEGVFGFVWNEYAALAIHQEENGFFGSYGTGDFIFGDSLSVILKLGYGWDLTPRLSASLHGQSAYGRMYYPPRSSIIRRVEGHRHQFTASLTYKTRFIRADLSLTHALGVDGVIDMAGLGSLSLRPDPATLARIAVTTNF